MDDSVIGHDTVAEWDPLKLSVDVSALGVSGYQPRTGWRQSTSSWYSSATPAGWSAP